MIGLQNPKRAISCRPMELREQASDCARRSGVSLAAAVVLRTDRRGWATSSPRVGPHWDETQQDKKAWYVDYQCEVLLPADDRLPVESLLAGDLGVPWNKLMASGVRSLRNAKRSLKNFGGPTLPQSAGSKSDFRFP